MKITSRILLLSIIFLLVGFGPFSFFQRSIEIPTDHKDWVEQKMKRIHSKVDNIDHEVLKLSLVAYLKAKKQKKGVRNLITIIDYSKPSIERRLWVIDLDNDEVLFNTWVTHGKNSGKNNATSFSNEPGSLKSSLGVFLTTTIPYNGGNGYSLRLIGLENGINDKALQRYIVFHGAWYADPKFIDEWGFLGRSWGCPAVSKQTARPLINTIKDKSLVFIYYPDRYWLNHSTFLA